MTGITNKDANESTPLTPHRGPTASAAHSAADRTPASPRLGVLFVCLGNICRSPLAEGIFLHHARLRGVADLFDIDSCGTSGWHAGAPPDPRSIAVAALRSISLDHRARELDPPSDFTRFQHILAMDRSNLRDIEAAGETHGVARPNVRLMLSAGAGSSGAERSGPGPQEVPDPYYGGSEGFERVFEMLNTSCGALIAELLSDLQGAERRTSR